MRTGTGNYFDTLCLRRSFSFGSASEVALFDPFNFVFCPPRENREMNASVKNHRLAKIFSESIVGDFRLSS